MSSSSARVSRFSQSPRRSSRSESASNGVSSTSSYGSSSSRSSVPVALQTGYSVRRDSSSSITAPSAAGVRPLNSARARVAPTASSSLYGSTASSSARDVPWSPYSGAPPPVLTRPASFRRGIVVDGSSSSATAAAALSSSGRALSRGSLHSRESISRTSSAGSSSVGSGGLCGNYAPRSRRVSSNQREDALQDTVRRDSYTPPTATTAASYDSGSSLSPKADSSSSRGAKLHSKMKLLASKVASGSRSPMSLGGRLGSFRSQQQQQQVNGVSSGNSSTMGMASPIRVRRDSSIDAALQPNKQVNKSHLLLSPYTASVTNALCKEILLAVRR
jgi:hypothetical protein